MEEMKAGGLIPKGIADKWGTQDQESQGKLLFLFYFVLGDASGLNKERINE